LIIALPSISGAAPPPAVKHLVTPPAGQTARDAFRRLIASLLNDPHPAKFRHGANVTARFLFPWMPSPITPRTARFPSYPRHIPVPQYRSCNLNNYHKNIIGNPQLIVFFPFQPLTVR
jgi:hypothetical protein